MIEPSYRVIPFESDAQKLSMLKKWGLASPKAKDMKPLYYKGLFSAEYTPCDVVGFSDNIFIVISVLGQLHSIHPDCLAEMQPSKKVAETLTQINPKDFLEGGNFLMAGLLSKLFSIKRGADDNPDDLLAPASPPIVSTVRVIPRRVPSSLAAVPLADIHLSSSGVSPSTFRDLSLDTAVFSPPINPDAYSTYTVIDVETTGVSCYSDEIIEVSALRFEHFAPTSLFTALVRPAKSSHIPTSASSVNMIADEDVANAVTFLELKDSLQAFLDEAPIIVGHNLSFDVRFLFGAGIEFPADKLYVDTMENARRYLGKQGPFNPPRLLGYSLENVCKFYGVPLKDAHYSAEDCLVTGAVYMALLYDMGQYKRALRTPFSAPEEYISIKSIIPEKDIDKSSPIYHKKIVFTGELSIVRREAMQLAVNAGMSLMSSVTPKTDYLVHGTYINGDYVTGKLKKARELNESGEGHVQIISENEFMALIGEGVCV